MRIFISGGFLAQDFENRIENSGLRLADTATKADLVLDLHITMHEKQQLMLELPEVDIYSLAYPASSTTIASIAPNPEKIIGFSTVSPLIPGKTVIELAKPWQSETKEIEKARDFFKKIGFESVVVPDSPGLVSARVIACLANEALSALSQGVADASTIDKAMKLGTNYPFGPLEWAERMRPAAVLAILQGLYEQYGERYQPHPYLKQLVAAGLSFDALKQLKTPSL